MSPKPTRSDSIASALDLARAFDSAVRESFKLTQAAGLTFELQVTISASVSGTVALDRIAYPFWVVARFEGRGLEGRICFGDRELFVRTEVEPTALDTVPPDGYAFWEWAAAFGESDAELSNTEWCIQPERVHEVVRHQVGWLEHHVSLIANPAKSVIDRLENARLERQVAWNAEERTRERRGKVRLARVALRQKAYASVVELLAPFEAELSPAELKLLTLARSGLKPGTREIGGRPA
jgi:hypothetical protein